jgi:hypothetical protein
MVWEDFTTSFHAQETLCTLVRITGSGRKTMMFSSNSGMLKTALRAAVMLRVRRRDVTATLFWRLVLRFCSACQHNAPQSYEVAELTLVGCSLSMISDFAV